MEIDKINVGMCVRTEHKGICQVIGFASSLTDDYIENEKGSMIPKDEIIKTRHNIIDLIEPQDLMYIDISPDDCGGIVVPRVAETMDELNHWKKLLRNGECILKGVVTREQLSDNVFEVGE